MSHSDVPAEWDELADLYDEINEQFIDYDEQTAFVLACIERWRPEARHVLDIGCGTGQHALRLAAQGLAVTGIDLSPRLMEIARSKAEATGSKAVEFQFGDAAAMAWAGRFDIAISMNFVLSSFRANEQLRALLEGVFAALQAGGLFLFDNHYFFPPTEETGGLGRWTEECTIGGQRVVISHAPIVDWNTQLSTDCVTHRFYDGETVVREVHSTEVRRITLPQDLQYHLQSAGFDIVEWCRRWELGSRPEGQLSALVARRS